MKKVKNFDWAEPKCITYDYGPGVILSQLNFQYSDNIPLVSHFCMILGKSAFLTGRLDLIGGYRL